MPTRLDHYLHARIVLRQSDKEARVVAGYTGRTPGRALKLATEILTWRLVERVPGEGPRETRALLDRLLANEARLTGEIERSRHLRRVLETSLDLAASGSSDLNEDATDDASDFETHDEDDEY